MTEGEAMRVIGFLREMYPQEKIGEMRLKVTAAFLHDFELEEASVIVSEWIATERRFPQIAELRERLVAHRGDGPPDIDLAWGEVEKELRRVGRYGSPVFGHPAIGEAVSSLGWDRLCSSENPSIDRAHFAKYYTTAAKRSQHEAQTEGVRSLVEATRSVLVGGRAPGMLPPGKDSKR